MAEGIYRNAQEALAGWRLSVRYQPDSDSGVTPDDLVHGAASVMCLAESEGILLETLVPDESERKLLIGFAAEYTTGTDHEHEYYKHSGMEFSSR